METLYDILDQYSRTDYYGFHMPGHKRNGSMMGIKLPYHIDITEIEGFDDLHHAEGILKKAQERAASVYGADETSYLVNGSTAGILSAIMGCTKRGDKILISRNCHKSVYHAVLLNSLEPIYIYPDFYEEKGLNGEIKIEDIADILEKNPDVKAVVITSPTYDGVISDIQGITYIAHTKGIPVIVDEAHGAHLGFHPYFPKNSNILGADVVIHSLHKTLPSLTQTALIHMNGNLADRREIRKYLHMLQTSSPSYIFMAAMDECIQMLNDNREKYFDPYIRILKEAREELGQLRFLSIAETRCYDRSKIVISTAGTNINGRDLYHRLLKEYHLQMEMASGTYVLAMTSICDTADGMKRFVGAMQEIDSHLHKNIEECGVSFALPELQQVYTPAQLDDMLKGDFRITTEEVCWEECVGRICTEYAYVYPPGIPLIVPGERISKEAKQLLQNYRAAGFSIEGLKNKGKTEVLCDG
ncbi:aminotransferase class I/II-fold pyridoxal phosphate-dependent enzyme [Luxibacter massiliensis]|uniref:aminotransferase class I/II-fold pyridoxal phosphate-dependent enzyme n=1 Tax=Luxibacter massiliensis TaxID=2219695 RepID=UPI000F06F031|nr:aminotransferase class I/II-fold pyridoxal phosphate-dependent enzyme [Luxibacter massiliensis]